MIRIEQVELDTLLKLHADTWIENNDTEVSLGETLQLFDYDLSGLNLSNRELRSCHLINCNLQNCNFSNSNISHSEFIGSNLIGANMNGVIDEGADYTNCSRNI